jgi:hypothetical protein
MSLWEFEPHFFLYIINYKQAVLFKYFMIYIFISIFIFLAIIIVIVKVNINSLNNYKAWVQVVPE